MNGGAAASRLIGRLPPVRGRLVANAPIAPLTRFHVGGPAEVLFRPADADDLAALLAATPADVPVTVIGVGSNLLVRDGGVAGIVIRLGRGFHGLATEGEEVTAGAGALDLTVARHAAEAGIAGLEFLCGIPGTVGGGFPTNAGAYGSEFKDVLVCADAIDRGGRRHRATAGQLGLGYRRSAMPRDWIVVAARFRGARGERAAIGRCMTAIRQAREASQPVRTRTGGSTFANPPGHEAWRLIAEAGCRGLRRGDAMVSEQHANFMVNTGKATAGELEALGEEVRARVHDRCGVLLDWEIRRIGEPAPAPAPPAAARTG